MSTLRESIYNFLAGYRLSNWEDEDGNSGYPLADALSNGAGSIAPGLGEIEDIADALAAHLASRDAVAFRIIGPRGPYPWVDISELEPGSNPVDVIGKNERIEYAYSIPAAKQAAEPVEQANPENRHDALCDSNYAAGMKLGWNLCVAGKDVEFNEIAESRMRSACAVLKKPKPEQAECCTCGGVIRPDAITGTTCACAKPKQSAHDEALAKLLAHGSELKERDARAQAARWQKEYDVLMPRKPEQAVGDGVDAMREVVELMRKSGGWHSGKATVSMPRKRAFRIITLLHDVITRPAVATCNRCGATSNYEAESRCVPDGDDCPGCNEPLASAWAVATPAEVTDGSIKRYRVRLVPEASALDGFVAAMVEDEKGDMVSYVDHCAALAAQPSAVGVTEGWKLVPVEPTEAMRKAGAAEVISWGSTLNPGSVYRAMLVAAPEVPLG